MKIKSHIIFTLILGVSSVFFIDAALNVLGVEENRVTECAHAGHGNLPSVPELAEENVLQEYIAPEAIYNPSCAIIFYKIIPNDLGESLYEHNTLVPPPDLI